MTSTAKHSLTRRGFLALVGGAVLCAGSTTLARGAEVPSLTATFLDMGKADAIVLTCDGAAALVDTGLEKTKDELLEALEDLGVKKLDLLVITHFDKDHVGGADAVLDTIPVRTVWSGAREKASDDVDEFDAALAKAGLKTVEVPSGQTFKLGSTTITAIAPEAADYEQDDSNNSSLVLRATCDKAKLLLTGDIQEERITELAKSGADLSCDVLKVPHHGRWEDNTPELVSLTSPSYAVITSSKSDKEDKKVVRAFEDAGAEVFLTRKGEVTATFGARISVTQD